MTAEGVGALAISAAVLVLAPRRGWLTLPGTGVAGAVGAAIWAGSGAAGIWLLLFFFASSVAAGRARRAARSPAGDEPVRGPRQVLANGGVAAGAALLGAATPLASGLAGTAVAGALAAATADTWSSELGAAAAGPTRRLVSGRPVEPGATGGVSGIGLAAAVGGATAAALVAAVAGLAGETLAVAAAGVAGAVADSVTGEVLEAGRGRLGNDAVNLVATTAGALVAVALASL